MKHCFYNLKYFGSDARFHEGGFCVENGVFTQVGEGENEQGTDLNGAYVLPGLIDIHTHGNAGFDFSTADADALKTIAQEHARMGVAGFCPTSMTLPEESLTASFKNAATLIKDPPEDGAAILGINMEGPYIALERKGAQNPAYLRAPDKALFERLYEAAEGHIAFVDIAPELEGALDFIKAAKGKAILSLAHSDADYDAAITAFDAGLSHMTHMFNAMPGLNHRKPGPIAAAADREHVKVELIADGIHIHPSILRLCFKLFGAERICLVSDSMEATGLLDGSYSLGGQEVTVKGNRATLQDGTIAGSVTPLYRCMQNAVRYGIRLEDAVRAASLTPAEQLKRQKELGSITTGKEASFVIADEELNIKAVWLRGRETASFL